MHVSALTCLPSIHLSIFIVNIRKRVELLTQDISYMKPGLIKPKHILFSY